MGAPDEKDLEEDLDAGWDDDEEQDDEGLEELDSGWEDVEPQGGDASPDAQRRPKRKREGRPARELTPEERGARAAARKERLKAKAAEKAGRRKTRASTAAAKQKKSLPRERVAKPTASVRPGAPVEDEGTEEIRAGSRVSVAPAPVTAPSRSPKWLDGRTIAIAVLVLLVGGAIAFVLTRR